MSMFEKVNPMHPDKIADRIAGAMMDVAYKHEDNPKVAIEVLIGHGKCLIIAETSYHFVYEDVKNIVDRITKTTIYSVEYIEVPQDEHLSKNQSDIIRCGDNGIFKGSPVTKEQWMLTDVAKDIYKSFPTDGKYLINKNDIVVCQSNAKDDDINNLLNKYKDDSGECYFNNRTINPLGYWEGTPEVDCGATNRKLGSDMGDSITGGGLHGKDLSKADVSLNISAWILAQNFNKDIYLSCAIGDDDVLGHKYRSFVELARMYIESIGGFEAFAEWGFIR